MRTQLRIGELNVNQGMRQKLSDLEEILLASGVDILLCCETGLGKGEENVNISKYTFFGTGRPEGGKKGGGVGLWVREDIRVIELETGGDSTELKWIGVPGIGGYKLALGVVYLACEGSRDWKIHNIRVVNQIKKDVLMLKEEGWQILLGGDWNSHIGKTTLMGVGGGAYDKWNFNGRLIAEMCQELGCEIWNLTPNIRKQGL